MQAELKAIAVEQNRVLFQIGLGGRATAAELEHDDMCPRSGPSSPLAASPRPISPFMCSSAPPLPADESMSLHADAPSPPAASTRSLSPSEGSSDQNQFERDETLRDGYRLSSPPVNKIADILSEALKELLAESPGFQDAGAAQHANSILLRCAESVYAQLEAMHYHPAYPDELSDVSRFRIEVCACKGIVTSVWGARCSG
jgi:hypothetical protein